MAVVKPKPKYKRALLGTYHMSSIFAFDSIGDSFDADFVFDVLDDESTTIVTKIKDVSVMRLLGAGNTLVEPDFKEFVSMKVGFADKEQLPEQIFPAWMKIWQEETGTSVERVQEYEDLEQVARTKVVSVRFDTKNLKTSAYYARRVGDEIVKENSLAPNRMMTTVVIERYKLSTEEATALFL